MGLLRAGTLVCALVVLAASASAAQAGWSKPFEFAKPGTLDYLPSQLAFSPGGAAAAAFGVEDADAPASSQAYLTSRTAGGAVGNPLKIGGAQQILALSYDGRAVELLTGASPSGQACCSSAQAVQVSAQGRLGRARTLVGGLTGDTQGRLLTLADGQMMAAVATQRGVWVVQSSRSNRFGAQHLLTGKGAQPESLAAAWLGGEQTVVAWTEGAARTIYVATGSRAKAPGHPRAALSLPAGHSIDELAVARRGSGATLTWTESWFDRGGAYHSQVQAADLAGHPRIRTLSSPARLASGLSFGADAAGDQGAAWESCTANASCAVQTARRGPKARFGGVSNLGSIDPSQSPSLAVGQRGQVMVAWVRGGRPVAAVGSASRGRFGSATSLSTSTYAADITAAFGRGSQALAAWTQGTLNTSVVGAAYR
ncbi:MAG: hypothetical protein WAK93_02135 [Solirubrobacteraceae bacterium]